MFVCLLVLFVLQRSESVGAKSCVDNMAVL